MFLLANILFFLYVLVKIYIAVMEIGYIKGAKAGKPIILTHSNYLKAADYKIATLRLDILSTLFSYLIFVFWFGFGLSYLEHLITIKDLALKAVVYVNAFLIINFFFTIGFDIYSTFYIDKKFGFSKMTPKLYLLDTIKSGVLTIIFGSIIVWIISKIILNFEFWWIYGFIFIFGIIIIINLIYPTLIAPIFNKFTKLENDDLREAIEKLLTSVNLKSDGVFVMDASKRDNRLNAYFGGLGKSKRVVLFDTLLEKLTKNELLAVLGHELGHFKHKDIIKNIIVMALMMFGLFAIFGLLPNSFFNELHIQNAPHSIITLFLILSTPLFFFMMPLFGLISRRNEYRADEFGAECESAEELANALIKLSNENKAFPRSHPLTIIFYHTHPPIVERLKKLGVAVEDEERDFKAEACQV